jgi:type II secretory pathway pseudopilin PulG
VAGLVVLALIVGATVSGLALWADAQRSRDELAAQQAQTQGEKARADKATRHAAQLQAQVQALEAQNKDLNVKLANPTLSVWNSCGTDPCSVGPNKVRVGGVPDTFQFHVVYTSDIPVSLYFFTFHQWTQYENCGFDVGCVTDSYTAYRPSTSRDVTFDDATGCAGYLFVLASTRNGTIKPDVTATYRPADHPTGVCAGDG